MVKCTLTVVVTLQYTVYTPGLGPWALSGKIKQPGSAGCEEVDGEEEEGGKDSSPAAAPHLEEE